MGRGSTCVVLLLIALGTPSAGCADAPGALPPAPPPPPAVGAAAGGLRGELGGEADTRAGAPASVVLVRTADVAITVDAYDAARDSLVAWLAERGGFVADEQVWRTDGRATSASLRVRVPADQLDPLLAWIDDQVVVDSVDSRAADVTAEWVDLEARIRAHQAAEERLLGLIADRAATLGDVLAAETELTRIRSEIEALRGRHRVLADQVALGTVQIHVRMRAPAAFAGVEPLTTEVRRAFVGSIAAMGQLGRVGLVVAAAVAPWVVLLAVVAGLGAVLLAGFGGGAGFVLRRRRLRAG